jgi:hypothetical protein
MTVRSRKRKDPAANGASEIVWLANFIDQNTNPAAKEQQAYRLYRRADAAADADPCLETHAIADFAKANWRAAYNVLLYSDFGRQT